MDYVSDGNSGPSFDQVENDPDIEAYHKDKVVANELEIKRNKKKIAHQVMIKLIKYKCLILNHIS